jgi:solute carrier family 25 folate transporter 32
MSNNSNDNSEAAAEADSNPERIDRHLYYLGPNMDHLISGLSAGMISTLILHPFDLIKTRLQVQTGTKIHQQSITQPPLSEYTKPKAITPLYKNSLDVCRSIIKNEGISSFYKGLEANLAGNTLAWGLYFFGYNRIKSYLTHYLHSGRKELNAGEHMLAASLTGSMVLLCTNPVWVVKTRQFLDYSNSLANHTTVTHKLGLLQSIRRIYKNEGIAGLYRGFVPGLLGVSHGKLITQ